MEKNYSEYTLEQCYLAGKFFDIECDGDKKEFKIKYNDQFGQLLQVLENCFDSIITIFKSSLDTVLNIVLEITDNRKYKTIKKSKRYIKIRNKNYNKIDIKKIPKVLK